ncbi:hypothetical protein [Alishewanella longhuensis]
MPRTWYLPAALALQRWQLKTAGAAKTKGKLDPDSFQFANDSHSGVPLFAEGGGVGFFNYAFEGMVSGF